MSITLSNLIEPRVLKSLYMQRTTLELEGPPGIGKSAVIRQFPRILSEALGEPFPAIDPVLKTEQMVPNIDAPDVKGFVIPTKDEYGKPVAMYTYPAIIPSKEFFAENPRGILFMDEANQGEHLTNKALASLYLEKIIGEYRLPEGWWVVTATNAMDHRSGVLKPMSHIVNRKRVISVTPDIDGWCAWARDNQIHPMGAAFARQFPGVVITNEVPADPKPFCTPRSFTSAMRLIAELAGSSMDIPCDHVTQELVEGDIGSGAASTFFGFVKVNDLLPTIEDIVERPNSAKVPPVERMDAAFAAREMCVFHANGDNIDAIWDYMMRLPKELQTSTAQVLIRKQGSGMLLNSANLGKWIKENRALIVSSTE